MKIIKSAFQMGFLEKIAKEEFRERVETIAVDRLGRILLGKKQKGDRIYYLFPGGGIEPGESLPEAGKREFQEETGKNIRNLRPTGESVTNRFKFFDPQKSHLSGSKTHFILGQIAGGRRPNIFGADKDVIENLLWSDPKIAYNLLLHGHEPSLQAAANRRAEIVKQLIGAQL